MIENDFIKNKIDFFSKNCSSGLLIVTYFNNLDLYQAKCQLEELKSLVDTLGIKVIDGLFVKLKKINSKYFIGKGKLDEIVEIIDKKGIDILVFDDDLSPSQQRNIEKIVKISVIDRHEVILDIFAKRAKTKVATLQVELARMQHKLSRLKHAWMHLSRQRGGAKGTRGEGEKQLEIDRRLVQNKIIMLKRELKKVVKQRETQRKKRMKIPLIVGSIVGYIYRK